MLSKRRQPWKQLGERIKQSHKHPLKPGLYHFQRSDPPNKTRLHLRIDPDGHGTLVINANQILHLNSSAAQICYLHLSGYNPQEIEATLQRWYSRERLSFSDDISTLRSDIDALIQGNGKGIHPHSEIEFHAPYSLHPRAPYRMDLALTYRCNNDCPHCYNARLRSYPEVDHKTWKMIIDRLWELGIPHLIFTGGEPTLREDLPELIAYAEGKGQITGLNTNGRRLADPDYVSQLIDAGLDHVQITLESHLPEIHDQMVNQPGAWNQTITGIKNAVNSSLFVMTNTTMLKNNQATIDQTLDFLSEIGVPTIGLNALIYAGRGKEVGTGLTEEELHPLLERAKKKTSLSDQKLIWYTPTLYCNFNPMEKGLGVKGCTAALYNMCIEPDGGVIPCQSYYHQLGKILEDTWEDIWEHDLALRLRTRAYLPKSCLSCHLAQECGAGCPLSLPNKLHQINPILPSPL